MQHSIPCPFCGQIFDLFGASWCQHTAHHASKICPHCLECACGHPDYGNPAAWGDPPLAFRKHGFRRLFVLYL